MEWLFASACSLASPIFLFWWSNQRCEWGLRDKGLATTRRCKEEGLASLRSPARKKTALPCRFGLAAGPGLLACGLHVPPRSVFTPCR